MGDYLEHDTFPHLSWVVVLIGKNLCKNQTQDLVRKSNCALFPYRSPSTVFFKAVFDVQVFFFKNCLTLSASNPSAFS